MRSYFYFDYVCCIIIIIIIIIIATLALITSSFDWISSSFPSSSCNHRTPIAFMWIAGWYGSTEILMSSSLSNVDHRPLRSKEDPCHGGGSFYHSRRGPFTHLSGLNVLNYTEVVKPIRILMEVRTWTHFNHENFDHFEHGAIWTNIKSAKQLSFPLQKWFFMLLRFDGYKGFMSWSAGISETVRKWTHFNHENFGNKSPVAYWKIAICHPVTKSFHLSSGELCTRHQQS